jgi:hypothetical protein
MCPRQFARVSIFLICMQLAHAALPSARAQQSPDLSALVDGVAKELVEFNFRKVAVFDFTGPKLFVSVPGRSLADQFNSGLANSGNGIAIIDRDVIKRAIESNRFAPEISSDPKIALWLARSLGASVAIVGKLALDGENLMITLDCFRTSNGKRFAGRSASVSLPEDTKSLLTKNVDPDSVFEAVTSGRSGRSLPRCVYCPSPELFTQASARVWFCLMRLSAETVVHVTSAY